MIYRKAPPQPARPLLKAAVGAGALVTLACSCGGKVGGGDASSDNGTSGGPGGPILGVVPFPEPPVLDAAANEATTPNAAIGACAAASDGDDSSEPPTGIPVGQTVFINPQSSVGGDCIAIDSTSVYWVQVTSTSSAPLVSSIMKVARTGGPATTLASYRGESFLSHCLAVDATNVYWSEPWAAGAPPSAPNPPGAIMKVPIAGGPSTLVASSHFPSSIAVDSANVYWMTGNNGDGSGVLMKASLAGGGPTVTLATAIAPTNIAVDATSVYWLTRWGAPSGTPLLMKVSVDGGTPSIAASLAYPGLVSYSDLVIDSTSAYFWAQVDGVATLRMFRVPLSGGSTGLTTSSASIVGDALDPFASAAGNLYGVSCDYWVRLPAAGGVSSRLAFLGNWLDHPIAVAVDSAGAYLLARNSQQRLGVFALPVQ
jgi:hypothetical protein